MQKEPANMDSLVRRPSAGRVVPVRLHDIIIIRGNIRTKNAVIESEVEELFKGATTFQELRHAAAVAEERLRGLDIFESVNVRVDPGPPDLPGTANVVIEFSEPSNPFAKVWGDIWDASGLGVFLPSFEAFRGPFSVRLTVLSQDWLKFNSYKERNIGYSLRVLSRGNHDLSHNFNWRSRPEEWGPPGHSLLSDLKYSFKIYPSDSPLRPTGGFKFLSTTQLCSISIGPRVLRFIRQDVDFRYAIPLGFCGANLKLGASAGVEYSFLVEGLRDIMDDGIWDLPVDSSADLSFDLPLKVLRDAGIRGHVSASTSSVNNLNKIRYREFSLRRFRNALKVDVGVGVIIPTRLFQMEVNFIHSFPRGSYPGKRRGMEFIFSRQ